MCGVAGIASDCRQAEAEHLVSQMTQALLHRGPHSGGTRTAYTGGGTVTLGARRLRVLDLSNVADQPMTDERTGSALAFNGEIYNFRELRSELRRRDYRFATAGDTEVVLRAYEEWGPQCFGRFRGMFALAIWDPRTETVVLARDQLGIKPLYLSIRSGQTVWASEVRAMEHALNAMEHDEAALDDFLRYGSVPEPRTIYREIEMAVPGAWLRLTPLGEVCERERFWDPAALKSDTSLLSTRKQQGSELLVRSVQRHLVSDAPLGVLLSSGMDSRALLGLAVKNSKDLHSFTVSFPDNQQSDEGPGAANAARTTGSSHHDIPVPTSDALPWVHDGLTSMDQPSSDGLNTYIVTRAIREYGLVVAVSGLGGDELFGGYPSFVQLPRWLKIRRSLGWMPHAMLRRVLEGAASRRSEIARMKLADLLEVGDNRRALYLQSRRVFSEADLRGMGRQEFKTASIESMLPLLDEDDLINSISLWESVFYMRNTLLRDADVFSMANSIELRVPLLDLDLFEWGLRMPGSTKVRPGKQKPLLAEIAGSELAGRRQPKRGFTLPFYSWLSGPLKPFARDALSDLGRSGYLDPRGIEAVWARYEREPDTAAWSRVWSLVVLSSWLSQDRGVPSSI